MFSYATSSCATSSCYAIMCYIIMRYVTLLSCAILSHAIMLCVLSCFITCYRLLSCVMLPEPFSCLNLEGENVIFGSCVDINLLKLKNSLFVTRLFIQRLLWSPYFDYIVSYNRSLGVYCIFHHA